ncbi:MAG TPA: ABC transporter permease [Candidatus Dormibacteraeota bacterium]|nr:ABC transporter permease [Candidatus Dormibacteraeota bacterium]
MVFLGQVIAWFLNPAHWTGSHGVPTRVLEHLQISGIAVGAALVIALPIGIALGHWGRGGLLAINVSNVGRALPSFGILVIAFEVFGLNNTPVLVALTLLAIPPVVTNSFIAVRDVDPELRDAARGMGMRERRVLFEVELPLALPLIMAGIRTAAVQVVATATLAALIAGGGLGRYILDGLGQRDDVQVFAGAALVALLAMAVELAFSGLEQIVTPRGIKGNPVGRMAVGVVEPRLF